MYQKIAIIFFLSASIACASDLGSGEIASIDDDRLEQAQKLYAALKYEDVVTVLEGIIDDETELPGDRSSAMRMLGQTYMRMAEDAKAAEVVKSWIQWNPVLATVDPENNSIEFINLFYRIRRELCGSYDVNCLPDTGDSSTIAILDFDNDSIDDREKLSGLGAGFADIMINKFIGATDLRVVERENIEWLKNEQDLGTTGRIDPNTAVEMGKMLGAHLVTFGNFIYFKKKVTLSVRLVKVETSEVLEGYTFEGKLDDLDGLMTTAATWLAKEINLDEGQIKDMSSHVETREADAILAYVEGKDRYARMDFAGAEEMFKRSLAIDPGYEAPKNLLEAMRHEFAAGK